MKRYTHVSELETELLADGFIKDRDINIPSEESGTDCGSMTDRQGNQIIYFDEYKSYYIIEAKKVI